MHKIIKPYLVILLITIAIVYSFALPKKKYSGTDILSQLKIPYRLDTWQGADVEQGLDLEDKKYNFISQTIEREYINAAGKNLSLSIMNADNFHNPKVCSNAAGFKVKELNDVELKVANRTIRTNAIYAQSGDEGYLLIYWMCINKDIVDWTEQKIKQLWYSLFNENKIGLMIRLDVPTDEDNIDDAHILANDFITALCNTLNQDDLDYIIGI